MYEKQQEAFGLTHQNFLWSRVSLKRAIEILRKDNVEILDQNSDELYIGTNLFGEFVFVTLRAKTDKDNVYVQFFGLGWHEYRETYLDYFKINTGNDFLYEDIPAIKDKEAFINMLIARDKDEKSYWADHEQSEAGWLFSEVADLTDEDGAYTELDDWGLL